MPRPRPTYSNVMVTLLAFVVLSGGAAYAAVQLGKGTVGTRQLKKNAVTSAKVKDGSLRRSDFAPGQLTPPVATGVGVVGPQGSRGPEGPPGPPGTSRAFQATGSVGFEQMSASLFGSTAVTLPLPPGTYFATASVDVQSVNAVAATVTCRLINGGGGAGSDATVRSQVARADGQVDNMTLAAGFTVSAGQALNLQCSKSAAGSGARINEANVVAVGVTAVSGSAE